MGLLRLYAASASVVGAGLVLPAACATRDEWPTAEALRQMRQEDLEDVRHWAETFNITGPEDAKLLIHVVTESLQSPECLADFDLKGELETRCPQLMYKVGIQRMHRESYYEAAEELFNHSRNFTYAGRQWISWRDPFQTPTVYVPDLEALPYHDCNRFPIASFLKENIDLLRKEFAEGPADELMESSYPYLGPRGLWRRLFLFQNKTWEQGACDAIPTICAGLKSRIPTVDSTSSYVVNNNEMAILFKLYPDSWVPPHSGASNTQINIHMSLWGSTELRVRDTWQKMEAGDVVCFDDSYLHEVYNRGDKERVAIVIRVMHPGMKAKHEASDPGRVSAEL
jgi:hypothetical protein